MAEEAAWRAPISLEESVQARDLSNFRGQTQGCEELGQGPRKSRRHPRGVREDWGLERDRGEECLPPDYDLGPDQREE